MIFAKELIKDRNVGAITSTSDYTIKKILNEIDFDNAMFLVEYGPGDGVITKQLLSKMKKEATLFVFETNSDFITKLKLIKDDRLIIINKDADNAKTILNNEYKIDNVDYIISTIPLSLIDSRKKRRIIHKSYVLLNEKGKFLTSQYSPITYNFIKTVFTNSNIKLSLISLPPAFIMTGVK